MKKSLTVLLTGATGYIGSAWLSHPSANVKKVIALVRDRNNIKYIPASSPALTVEIREGSIPSIDPESLLEGVDVVVHLAARTPSRGDTESPAVFEEDKIWTRRLGVVCKARGTKLVFISTSSIYAGTKGDLLSEDTVLIKPQGPYPTSKYAAEEVLRALAKKGLPLTVLRFGSVFGAAPAVNFNVAVNKFVRQAFLGEPITVWRTALDQMRPYTHIRDCAAAINFVIEHDLFSGDVYNIVSENTTVRAILAEVEKHISPITTSIIDDERMNNLSFGMDDTKIRSLGFSPQGTLEQGIVELLPILNSRAV